MIQSQRAFLKISFILVCPCHFGMIYHNILPATIASAFDSAAPYWQTEVFSRTSKNSLNLRSNLFVLGFFTVTNGPGEIGLLSVNPP